MMKTDIVITRTIKLSKRHTCTMTAGKSGLTCEWHPAMPRKLTADELAAYRNARDELLAELAEKTGEAFLCVEV